MTDRWVLVAVAGALSFVAMLHMDIVNAARTGHDTAYPTSTAKPPNPPSEEPHP
ncbi:hypothetical protein [Streptomyces sp. SD31]|uniref:hypothetical protein n=1 Tax=Streptomyces sp. SD31 TaxID=3452208 RepID=UPI003F8CF200